MPRKTENNFENYGNADDAKKSVSDVEHLSSYLSPEEEKPLSASELEQLEKAASERFPEKRISRTRISTRKRTITSETLPDVKINNLKW